ncbi:hypothetical protein PDR5_35970 [Pseudomonas sp. DR 5-09]|nr:hypothetical protein PDR5_35970 [Pseudomonas sp. DR 5-09]
MFGENIYYVFLKRYGANIESFWFGNKWGGFLISYFPSKLLFK